MKNLNVNRPKFPILRCLALCAFATLSACSSSPDPNLYLLKSTNAPAISQASSNVSVVVGPITMSEYLKRSEVVFQTNTHDVKINENERWAESLERNITSVITSNVASYLGTDQAFNYYANFSTQPDYSVKLNVTEFGRVSYDTVSLSVSWELVNKSTRQTKLYLENINVPINFSGDSEDGPDVGHVVAAMNQAVNDLSLRISNRIIGRNPIL